MHKLCTEVYNGLRGVKILDSGLPGPTVAISVCVHGGEVTGLKIIAMIESLLQQKKLKLKQGKLMFILANIEAYQLFEHTVSEGADVLTAMNTSRYIDKNMNRLGDLNLLVNSTLSEVKRIIDLLPILEEVDVVFDIHTTTTPSDSMMIYANTSDVDRYAGVFDVKEHFVGLIDYLTGKPFINLVEATGGRGVAMEAGCEIDQNGFDLGLYNTIKFLVHEGVVSFVDLSLLNQSPMKNNQIINVTGSIMFRNEKFTSPFLCDRQFGHGRVLPKGTLIAFDGLENIILAGATTIVLPTRDMIHVGEEFCFLAEV